MAERDFDTTRRLRATKLFCEDYSSSSNDSNYWDNDIENVLSDEEEEEEATPVSDTNSH